ncbi:DctP family TRAP transporter solute-binding subunit [Gudongella sp. DL1XJH-153]|uniref:DctP family TRAP transporter solute-binding subunit n=1 Tax=Gudongella sp. DL1XJH-153 TaxID=3409804 RepID=UPI003BB78E7C
MKKKLTLAVTLVLAMTMLLAGCAGNDNGAENPDSSETVELKFSSAANEDSTWHVGVQKFIDEVEEKTDGKFQITAFTSDQLSGGNQASGIELVQTGSTDIHITDALVWSSIQPKAIAPAMPWLLPTYEDVDMYMAGAGGEAIKEAINESGVVCIGIGEAGYRQVVNTRNPIETPEDMSGLKMRIPGSNVHVSLLKYIGADPITMSQSEVYTSLQQGSIEAAENTIDLLFAQRTLEVVDHLTLWNYSYDPLFLSVSQELWESLSDEEKQIFTDAGEVAMDAQKQATREKSSSVLEDIRTEFPDLEIVESLTAEQVEAFKEKVKPVYEENKDSIGEELLTNFGYTFD